ncbi:hypothetical protein SVA_0207 [Sulfurifustis variabilis]|uniref:Uncharacterized protein n=1 Tax=Sulfurifustis variabilis TaxID=1675686 RepID=A0A1B4V037_9GAMM|nr:hypothetical protein [Sulfurifustis variabilis]BAU46789.1 hypothetical protein SVA_0207 [Sulfurifustis variabilis]
MAKRQLRWFEFTQYDAFCPHCNAKVEVDRKTQWWASLMLPALLLLPWHVALTKHGVEAYVLWGAYGSGLFGLVMAFAKRRLVAANDD